MILDILILAVAAALAAGVAFLSGSLNQALMLVPVNRLKPLKDRHEGFVRYNLVPYGELRDRNSYRPKVLLAVLLFAVLAALGKGLLDGSGDWTYVAWGGMGVIGLTMLGLGGFTNTAAVLVMLLIGPVIVFFLVVEGDAQDDPTAPVAAQTDATASPTPAPEDASPDASAVPFRWLGLAAGVMVGSFGGIWISRNYRTLLTHTDLEIKRRHTLRGEPLGTFALWKRRITLYWLILIPLFVVYQSLAYWIPAIDLGGSVAMTPGGDAGAGRIALIVLAFGIGMNLLFVTLPLFREMVTTANMTVAAEFNKIVWKWGPEIEEPPAESPLGGDDDDDDPNKSVTQFLTPKGEWQSFPRSQLFYFQTAVLALTATGVAQVLLKTAQGGAGAEPVFEGATLGEMGTLLSGITFCANVLFLLVVLLFFVREPGEKDAVEENVKILWERQNRPDLVVTCAEIDEDDDPLMRIVPEASADTPAADATMPTSTPEGSADA